MIGAAHGGVTQGMSCSHGSETGSACWVSPRLGLTSGRPSQLIKAIISVGSYVMGNVVIWRHGVRLDMMRCV